MHQDEFLSEPAVFKYVDVAHRNSVIELSSNSLAYTICQVPVVHIRGGEECIEVKMSDGSIQRVEGLGLDVELSREIFERSNRIIQLTVFG